MAGWRRRRGTHVSGELHVRTKGYINTKRRSLSCDTGLRLYYCFVSPEEVWSVWRRRWRRRQGQGRHAGATRGYPRPTVLDPLPQSSSEPARAFHAALLCRQFGLHHQHAPQETESLAWKREGEMYGTRMNVMMTNASMSNESCCEHDVGDYE